ncbi:MAG: type II toxin-antitoxin system HicA family toxin [Halovenus sp.]|uniref:type II toxin-antitoxin system HicA family toxin n=1 Tax=Halovenus amylolytica TaxID=2500550 RepID=UPI000FE419E4
MVTRDFSGEEIYRVLVNTGNFRHVRTSGSHLIVEWIPPEDHNTEPRRVTIPLHDRIDLGTLRSIADQAGAENFDAFCEWIDQNR